MASATGPDNADFTCIGPFARHAGNPILDPDPTLWFERECVYNPAVIAADGQFYMLYRAEDRYGEYVSRICLATSDDGIHFQRHPENPVLAPDGEYADLETRGCEDPRLVRVGSTFYLTYTAWNGRDINLALATSEDLVHWKKHGVIIPGQKSGAILDQPVDGRYVMYFGDTSIWAAYSTDLLHWQTEPMAVFAPRPDHFDSLLVEPGPPPVLTPEGILLIYNSSDGTSYNVGQVLLDRRNPSHVLARTAQPVFSPELAFEKYGKVNRVVFVESMVRHGDEWYLYYGAADKCVGLAKASARRA